MLLGSKTIYGRVDYSKNLQEKIQKRDNIMDKYSEDIIRSKYRHFTERRIPFEDTIVDVLAPDNVPYSERWDFLKSIYLITSKGYYIRYDDICGPFSHCDVDEQPYDIFLEGAIKCAYCYAYNAEIEMTLNYIRKILSAGKICVSSYYRNRQVVEGHFKFSFTLPWFSWLFEEDRKN